MARTRPAALAPEDFEGLAGSVPVVAGWPLPVRVQLVGELEAVVLGRTRDARGRRCPDERERERQSEETARAGHASDRTTLPAADATCRQDARPRRGPCRRTRGASPEPAPLAQGRGPRLHGHAP